jgi:hypothetical protein
MANFDEKRVAQPEEDEDKGIDFTDIPRITDFSGAKRVRDYGTAADVIRILYQEKLDRAAKVAAEQNDESE